jgi:carnitine 3-dehydrogenase
MTFIDAERVRSVAILGTGTVGASCRALISSAWPSLHRAGLTRLETPDFNALTMVASLAEAVTGVDLVIENIPENPQMKQDLIAQVDALAPGHVVILSTTGGIPASMLQQGCRHPGRIAVFHPFNPAHLVPLIEVVPGRETDEQVTEFAMGFARRLGKRPIRLGAEMNGHLTNKLQFALVREAVRALVDGVASPEDIDAALRYGLAPRWLLMGGLQMLDLAGGPGGINAILAHAGKAVEQWWAPGPDVLLTPEVRAALDDACTRLAAGIPLTEWMGWRDAGLLTVLQAQRQADLTSPARHPDQGEN